MENHKNLILYQMFYANQLLGMFYHCVVFLLVLEFWEQRIMAMYFCIQRKWVRHFQKMRHAYTHWVTTGNRCIISSMHGSMHHHKSGSLWLFIALRSRENINATTTIRITIVDTFNLFISLSTLALEEKKSPDHGHCYFYPKYLVKIY